MAVNSTEYDFLKIEDYWQSFWKENGTFRAKDFQDGERVYVLSMFPYPSGEGLHIGHSENYTAPDIFARFQRARGCNILQPMGWDAFGLPTEQYAVTTGIHPRKITERNKDRFRSQLKRHGLAIDWEREIDTSKEKYFKWTQWTFLQMFKHGLAYVADRPVWWCPALGTVQANEEVIDGRSLRGNHPVERRNLRQWVLRITAYAERLINQLEELDWPASTKRQQKAWIGRSEGTEIIFEITDCPNEKLEAFTTRPDTLFGATYMVLAPEHPLIPKLTKPENWDAVNRYIQLASNKSDLDRTDLAKEKTGEPTGSFALNPLSGKRIPIWIADYVLMTYGTGVIMAVPAHDERDFEFAKKYRLPIVEVISKNDTTDGGGKEPSPYIGTGKMINSGSYNGMQSNIALGKIIADLKDSGKGKQTINYKLRDWLFSRQRYWGEPFPIVWIKEEDYLKAKRFEDSKVASYLPKEPVYFEENGIRRYAMPIPPTELPLNLPEIKIIEPSGSEESPLANVSDWVNVYYNILTGETRSVSDSLEDLARDDWALARRETNTMPQWAGSCWYHLRYIDPNNTTKLIDEELDRYWGGGPDYYIGGAEHAVLHLLYARFWQMFLHDIGFVSKPEPYKRLIHQGMILGEDGSKMSKSIGNVVNPDEVINLFGADAMRLYLMFMGPLQDSKPWSTQSVEGISRFLRRVWRIYFDRKGKISSKIQADRDDSETNRLLHATIKKVTSDILDFHFNTAVSQLMIFANHLQKVPSVSKDTASRFCQILAPFAPHFAEEVWERLGETSSIIDHPWPEFDEQKLIQEEVTIVFQVNGKFRGDSKISMDAQKEQVIEVAKKHPRVSPHLSGKGIQKVIYVPRKILNIVTS
ncbi:MAG: leucine--tRNA ligase [Rhodospirillaceae bacterium]|uniref:Leucine--tRNA ligase n=1 Tax=Candidatus Moanibacter tarae TaxID=2200854 RepID=A0A2Z4AFC0_9BACT|nr:MAG: Leucine--tRNA ligase [Candidatus Moanabacter tarae]MBH66967.1 leucine--tRNA ligase [Rhodospirillaceae bacterium]|tara:strand:- start:3920 stop:6523 length:2604 start_codon:yes stop_codon:yes gene_type:complete